MIDKLIIGTVQFGINYGITNKNEKISDNEIDKIFNFCNNNNILYFDTAQDYGISEDILSKYKKIYPNFKIITKCKFNKDNKYSDIINISINKFENIECFLLHSYNDYTPEIIDELLKYKHNNVSKIGVSVYNIEEAIKCLEDKNIDIIQIPFNYINNQWFNERFLNLIKDRKNEIEIHVRSIFLQGCLLNPIIKKPINIEQDEFDKLNEIINQICEELNLNRLELCFAYINSFDWINKFLIGIDNYEHLLINYEIINKNIKLSKKDIYFIQNKIKDINQLIYNPQKWIF